MAAALPGLLATPLAAKARVMQIGVNMIENPAAPFGSAQAEAMNATSASVGPGVDEFALAGLDTLPSTIVAPPRVAGSPVHFECRMTQLIRLEDRHGEELDQWLVIGEAVGIHIDPAMLEDGVYQTARPVPITRGGGPADYFAITQDALFRMKRPD